MDFVIIDAEHGVSDLESCEHQVRAAEVVGISTMCRIALNAPQKHPALPGHGRMGAQIPQVNSAAEARATVDAVRYPPVGLRGLAGVRAGGYGIGMPLGEYVKLANEELILCVQIETTRAVEAAAEIVATEGVDLVFVGPTDLSISMGYPGQPWTHPAVMEAWSTWAEAAVAAGKWAGTIASASRRCADRAERAAEHPALPGHGRDGGADPAGELGEARATTRAVPARRAARAGGVRARLRHRDAAGRVREAGQRGADPVRADRDDAGRRGGGGDRGDGGRRPGVRRADGPVDLDGVPGAARTRR